MEIIVIKSGTYRELMRRLAAIEEYICTGQQQQQLPQQQYQAPFMEELWLDNATVCACLKVSRRTLQRYRSAGILAYSIVGNCRYRASLVA